MFESMAIANAIKRFQKQDVILVLQRLEVKDNSKCRIPQHRIFLFPRLNFVSGL
jgi:hypothetical protein